MIYDNDQTRKYRVGHMTMDITYSDTTDEYYKKLKVLRAVMIIGQRRIVIYLLIHQRVEDMVKIVKSLTR